MYSLAPRCSEAWSPRSVPECRVSPPSAANAEADSSPANTAMVNSVANLRVIGRKALVMRGHPFRHRLGLVDPGPQRHGDEEHEVEEGQHAADDGLDRIGARPVADQPKPDEADHEHQQHRPGQLAAIAIGLDRALVQPWHQAVSYT